MHAPTLHALLALLAATATAQSSTRTATVLLPDWCVTQPTPSVTVRGQQDGLTTYSYRCLDSSLSSVHSTITSAAAVVSSLEARASSFADSVRSRASAVQKRQDDACFGPDIPSFDACVPWEIIQGASTWAVHLTLTSSVALDQECTFGAGGVASGPATCTASGRIDPGVWGGEGDSSRTRQFASSEVDRYFIRDAVTVTAGGDAATTTTSNSATRTPAATSGSQSGGAGAFAVPTGAVAMAVGAGGVLAAALAL